MYKLCCDTGIPKSRLFNEIKSRIRNNYGSEETQKYSYLFRHDNADERNAKLEELSIKVSSINAVSEYINSNYNTHFDSESFIRYIHNHLISTKNIDDLAEELHVSSRSIQYYLSGTCVPGYRTCIALVLRFNLSKKDADIFYEYTNTKIGDIEKHRKKFLNNEETILEYNKHVIYSMAFDDPEQFAGLSEWNSFGIDYITNELGEECTEEIINIFSN